jgi:hypothetical protein
MEYIDKISSKGEPIDSDGSSRQWLLGGPHHNLMNEDLWDVSVEELASRSRRTASFRQLDGLFRTIEFLEAAAKQGQLPFNLQSESCIGQGVSILINGQVSLFRVTVTFVSIHMAPWTSIVSFFRGFFYQSQTISN